MSASCPELCIFVCVLQANIIIRGVVVPDVRWVVPNMLFLCMLHIKSTVSCFILEVKKSEPLVYHILLVC